MPWYHAISVIFMIWMLLRKKRERHIAQLPECYGAMRFVFLAICIGYIFTCYLT